MFYRRWHRFLSILLVCVMMVSLLAGNAEARQNTLPSTSPKIPENPDILLSNQLKSFGDFAWQSFVALNWPADCHTRKPLNIQIGQDPDQPRVWEFYHFPADIFLENGKRPDLKGNPVIPPQCAGDNDGSKIKSAPLRFTEFGKNPIFAPTAGGEVIDTLAFGDALIDAAGNYVLSEASSMNPVEVSQILENGWYSAQNLTDDHFNNIVSLSGNPFQLVCSSEKDHGVFPGTSPGLSPCRAIGRTGANEPVGSMELKAAWMVLPSEASSDSSSMAPKPDSNQYYTTSRTLKVKFVTESGDVEKGHPVTVPVALIGFHILHKTSAQGWVWATFEHIDNAPYQSSQLLPPKERKQMEVPEGVDCYIPPDQPSNAYTLYNPESKNPVNQPAQRPYLWQAHFPYAVTRDKETGSIVAQQESQIARQVCIPDFAHERNEWWYTQLEGSVWANYRLIGVQWLRSPTNPYNTDLRQVFPGKLANVSLEPFPQSERNGLSCIGCHTIAPIQVSSHVKSDFSFLINKAQ